MFRFLKENSGVIVKLIVYQAALTVFGVLLYNVSKFSQNGAIVIGISAFSALFYLFIIYTNIWEIGARDKIRIEGKRLAPRPLHGLWVGIAANVPNYLLAILSTVGYIFIDRTVTTAEGLFSTPVWAVNLYSISQFAGAFFNGTYLGITDTIGVYQHPLTLVIITLPAILATFGGYYLGTKEKFPIIAEKNNKDF